LAVAGELKKNKLLEIERGSLELCMQLQCNYLPGLDRRRR